MALRSGTVASPRNLLEMQKPGPIREKHLHFNKIPGWFTFTLKPELYWSRAVILGCGVLEHLISAKYIRDIVVNTRNILYIKIAITAKALLKCRGKTQYLLVNFKMFMISFPFYSTKHCINQRRQKSFKIQLKTDKSWKIEVS